MTSLIAVALRRSLSTSKRCALLRSLTSTAGTSTNTPSLTTSIPSVQDILIKLNFVDPSGARRQVPGIIGKSLYEVCEMHGIDLGPSSSGGKVQAVRSDTWTEPLYGEGPTTGYDHVLLVGNGIETAEPMTHVEKKMLADYWDEDELFPESRLASQVTLTKEMDGMTIYVPDRLVDDIP